MQGARELYSLIRFVGEIKNNLCGLKQIKNISGYSEETYQYENIVFLLGEHARGYTLKIWLYKNTDIQDYLKEEHIEAYGIISGNAGWTETYGWIAKGNWCSCVEKYFSSLRSYSEEVKSKKRILNAAYAEQERLKKDEKLKSFSNMFPDKEQ